MRCILHLKISSVYSWRLFKGFLILTSISSRNRIFLVISKSEERALSLGLKKEMVLQRYDEFWPGSIAKNVCVTKGFLIGVLKTGTPGFFFVFCKMKKCWQQFFYLSTYQSSLNNARIVPKNKTNWRHALKNANAKGR